jgi:hypothetical protein
MTQGVRKAKESSFTWALVIASSCLAVCGCGLFSTRPGNSATQETGQEATISPETTVAPKTETETGGATAEHGDTEAGGDVTQSTEVSEETHVSADTSLHEEISSLQQSVQELRQQSGSLESGLNEQFAREIGRMRDSIQQVNNTVENVGISELRRDLEEFRIEQERGREASLGLVLAGTLLIAYMAPNVFPRWLKPAVAIAGVSCIVIAWLFPSLFSL